jgi:trans-aconitate methyltransferase
MASDSRDTARRREFDPSVAHPARVYDYWLGGKDNFAADRAAAEQALEAYPDIRDGVRANRAFLGRAVRFLVGEARIRQFLDIGTGIPTDNMHQAAQAVAPESRIVYVDNDPMVISHARALLSSTPQGACAYIEADLRDGGGVVKQAADTLDFSRPVAVTVLATLQFIPDADDPYGIVKHLMSKTAPGSYLAISHPASDLDSEKAAEVARRYNELVTGTLTLRTREEASRFFDDLELLEPGVVTPSQWRPEAGIGAFLPGTMWAGVARKP